MNAVAHGARPDDHGVVVMTEAAAGELCQLLDEQGLRYWVVGGWGVDALLGRCTREHKDLDVLFGVSQHALAWRLLHDNGYLLAYRWEENVDVPGDLLEGEVQPTVYVLEDRSGRQVDVHVLDDRSPDLLPLWSTDRKFISGALAAQGTIDGLRVRCMSAHMQLGRTRATTCPRRTRPTSRSYGIRPAQATIEVSPLDARWSAR